MKDVAISTLIRSSDNKGTNNLQLARDSSLKGDNKPLESFLSTWRAPNIEQILAKLNNVDSDIDQIRNNFNDPRGFLECLNGDLQKSFNDQLAKFDLVDGKKRKNNRYNKRIIGDTQYNLRNYLN